MKKNEYKISLFPKIYCYLFTQNWQWNVRSGFTWIDKMCLLSFCLNANCLEHKSQVKRRFAWFNMWICNAFLLSVVFWQIWHLRMMIWVRKIFYKKISRRKECISTCRKFYLNISELECHWMWSLIRPCVLSLRWQHFRYPRLSWSFL